MIKRFPRELSSAWIQYQDLYDRYMKLLRCIGEGAIKEVYTSYEEQIEYALNEWQSPDERFNSGSFDDIDLGLDGED